MTKPATEITLDALNEVHLAFTAAQSASRVMLPETEEYAQMALEVQETIAGLVFALSSTHIMTPLIAEQEWGYTETVRWLRWLSGLDACADRLDWASGSILVQGMRSAPTT